MPSNCCYCVQLVSKYKLYIDYVYTIGKDAMQPRMLKTALRKSARTRLVNIKCTKFEIDQIQNLADMYADGNKSEWMRYAALHFRPRKQDLIPYDETDPDSKLVIVESSVTPPPAV